MASSKRLLFVVIQILYFTQIQGQSNSLYFDVITRDEGIASNRVNCIYEDKTGFIWFGTEDGLNKYAGDYIETYTHSTSDSASLINNGITAILEEQSTGNMWIGTQNGLSYFEKSTGKFSSFLKNTNGNINSLCYDKTNNLWIAADFGLFKYEGNGNFIQYKHNPNSSKSLSSNTVSALALDSKGNLLIGTDKGLDMYDPETNSFLHHNQTEGLRRVISIYCAKNNHIWVGTYLNGLFKMDDDTFLSSPMKAYNKANGFLLNDRVTSICEDSYNNLFIADRDGGLIYFDVKNNNIRKYERDIYNRHGINSNALICMNMSSDNILRIGTFNSGVNIVDFNRKPFEHYELNFKEDGLFNNNIRAMFQDIEGKIWIGTKDGGGLSMFNREKGTFKHYKHAGGKANRLQDDYVFQINEIDKRHLIIGTYKKGIAVFDKQTEAFTHYLHNPNDPSSICSNKVYVIYKDIKGTIWVGNYGYVGAKGSLQIFHPDKGTFTRIDHVQNVRAICNVDSENLWLGTYNKGLFTYNITTQKLTPFKVDGNPCFTASNITVLKKDSKGNLWVGTNGGGLVIIDKDGRKCKALNDTNGLPNNRVLGIEIDNNDNVWVSTGNGMAKYNPNTNHFTVFDKNDGLQGNEFETYVSAKTKTGEILFGGRNGFNIFHPSRIKQNTKIPTVHLTGLKLFHKPVEVGAKGSPLQKPISETKVLTLTHKQSVITFDFIALNYTSSDKNLYAHKLEGFDSEWIETGHKHEAVYANLPAGEYILKVKASNNDGVWSEKPCVITVVVLPPWWETTWFRILAVVCIVGSAIGYYLNRMRAIKAENAKLEKLVELRTEKLQLANAELQEQQEEIIAQNEEISQKAEELRAMNDELQEQRDTIKQSAEELRATNEELHEQRDTLQRSYDNMKLLGEFGQNITSVLSINEVSSIVSTYIHNFMEADSFGMALLTERRKELIFENFVRNGEVADHFATSLSAENSLAVRCLQEVSEFRSNNLPDDYGDYINSSDEIDDKFVPNSVIYVPLLLDEKAIGVLIVHHQNPNMYNVLHLNILKNLASYLSIAISNAKSYEIIQHKNTDINSSIQYAQTIQQAILPLKEHIRKFFDYFSIFKPKDVVSGDFYWFTSIERESQSALNLFAVIDCTGHGVPGAIMSIVSNGALNRIVKERNIVEPSAILEALDAEIRTILKQDKTENTDGMDVCLCSFTQLANGQQEVLFSASKRPLYIFRQESEKLESYKGTRRYIGGVKSKKTEDFKTQKFTLTTGDIVYMSSDGFVDQHGPDRSRYGSKRFREALQEIGKLSVDNQFNFLTKEFEDHRAHEEQRDDVTLVGLKML